MPHAYFKQVVTGLTPLATYTCSAWMVQMTRNDRWIELAQIWLEALGGAAGNVSRKTPYVTDNVNNNPGGWKMYSVTNTASVNGTIELRLHYNIIKTTAQVWEYRNMSGYYDHVSVVPVGGQAEPTPAYNIDSFTLVNQTATIGWDSVSNHIYGIQATSDPLSGANWNWVKLFLVATGPDMTTDMPVTTNVTGFPQYFRVSRVWPYP
jgi:hypothetical protein